MATRTTTAGPLWITFRGASPLLALGWAVWMAAALGGGLSIAGPCGAGGALEWEAMRGL